MSYLVLARKYRSRSFEELVGQEHVVKALTNALTQGRLHHAYLFTGTRGVGKTSVSRILAKSLNCVGPDGQGGITAHPCGACHACRDIDAGRFVDYIELDAASNRGVDEITTLLDQAVYKPVVGRFKVYMIDEVHMLSTTAFNAMLKTLEEPPEYLKFVLATTDPQKVPPTVLSRCLQFNLRPMAPQTIQQHLAGVLSDEHIETDAGALRLLSRAARGSMRDALSLTDQAIAYGAGQLTESGVREMLGAVDRGHAVRIVETLAAADGAGLVAASDALRALGLSASGTLDELAELLQQMAVVQAVPDALDASDPESPTVLRLSTLLAADELQLLYSMALHGRAELGLAPDEYSGLVMVLLRMLAFRPDDAPRHAPGRRVGAASAALASSTGLNTGPTGRAMPPSASAEAPGSISPPSPGAPATPMQPAITSAAVPGVGPSASVSVAASGSRSGSGSASATPPGGSPATSKADDPVRPAGSPAMTAASAVPVSPPREAALRRSASTAATVRVATDPSAAADSSSAVRTAGASAPTSGTPSPAPRAAITAPTHVDSDADADADADAVDFGEPPPWLDVPFDADEDVAVMPPPARAPTPAASDTRAHEMAAPNARAPVPADSPASRPTSSTSPARVSAPAVQGRTRPAAELSAPVELVTTPLGDRWADVVAGMTQAGTIGALVRELALQSECLEAAEAGAPGAWRLRVERESLRAPAAVEKLRAAMSKLLGIDVRLDVERGQASDSPALRMAAERERRQREAERLIQDDPLVQSLMTQFKTARIVPGSIKPV